MALASWFPVCRGFLEKRLAGLHGYRVRRRWRRSRRLGLCARGKRLLVELEGKETEYHLVELE
jgi:hypothetical protein